MSACSYRWRWLASIAMCLAMSATATGQSVDQLEQQAIRDAIQSVSPSIVQLQIIGGADRLDDVTLADGPSTGILLSADGYVVTSRYRFDPAPATVIALLEDGRQFATQVIATDFSRKLVLLKLVGAEDLPAASVAPGDSYRVGQWAIAVGRAYRVDRPNVSVGIVSALRRIQGRALQTDAAVSAANYGGALIDIQGRLLGIIAPMSPSSEKSIAGVEWYDSGIGFAIPVADWLPAFERLKRGENLELGYLGVTLAEGPARETPPELKSVTPGGPAELAKLSTGDVITKVDSQPVATQTQLQHAIKPHYAGDSVELTYRRDGELKTATLELTSISELQELTREAESEEASEPNSDD